MKIKTITSGMLNSNTYVIDNDKGSAVVIDAGDGYADVLEYINNNKLTVKAVLLTHGHFDHAGSAKNFQDEGAKVYLHKLDAHMLNDKSNLAWICGGKFNNFTADYFVEDGQEINIDGMKFKVLHTPGHTAGGVCYLTDCGLFCGDTLFRLSIGRTDFPTGNHDQILESLKKLFSLDIDVTCYCGHDQVTTLKYEKENNPYA